MSCPCKNKDTDPVTTDRPQIKPTEQCLRCAEKHLATAGALMFEDSYTETNRFWAIGQMNLAEMHTAFQYKDIAKMMRDIRHDIQSQVTLKKEIFENVWKKIKEKKKEEMPVIYLISNVAYPEANKLTPKADDTLVFLNKAASYSYYPDHTKKILFRRKPADDDGKENYGPALEGCDNRFCFDGPADKTIPPEFIDSLKAGYDWNYDPGMTTDPKTGKQKRATQSCTTGYMVAMYLKLMNPESEVVLVNFGYEVTNSTYRCPWHNWQFEAQQLKSFKHIFTAKTNA